jgi:hypothetical protein
VTNYEFSLSLLGRLAPDERGLYCSFRGDPKDRKIWTGKPIEMMDDQIEDPRSNNFLCVSAFTPDQSGRWNCRAAQFSSLRFVMLDDVLDTASLPARPTYVVETSPGNHQVGYKLSDPILDRDLAARVLGAISKGVGNLGGNNVTRWARLPIGTNGKMAYGGRVKHRLISIENRTIEWRALCASFGVSQPQVFHRPVVVALDGSHLEGAVPALKSLGLYRRPLGGGRHSITCPNVREHTGGEQGTSDTVFFEPSEANGGRGGLKCLHSHCEHINLDLMIALIELAGSFQRRAIINERGQIVGQHEEPTA